MSSTATIERVKAADNPTPGMYLDCVYARCTVAGDRAGPVYGMGRSSVDLVLRRLDRECACGRSHVEVAL